VRVNELGGNSSEGAKYLPCNSSLDANTSTRKVRACRVVGVRSVRRARRASNARFTQRQWQLARFWQLVNIVTRATSDRMEGVVKSRA
jgi:hypothetical protein